MDSKVYDVNIIAIKQDDNALVSLPLNHEEENDHDARLSRHDHDDDAHRGMAPIRAPRVQEIVEIFSSSSSDDEDYCRGYVVYNVDSDDDDDDNGGEDDDIQGVWKLPIRISPDLSRVVESISDSTSDGEKADQEDEGNDEKSMNSLEDNNKDDDDDDDEVVVLEIPPVAFARARPKNTSFLDSDSSSSSYERRRRRDRKRPAPLRSITELSKHFKAMDRKLPAKRLPGPLITAKPDDLLLFSSIVSPSLSQSQSKPLPPSSVATTTTTTTKPPSRAGAELATTKTTRAGAGAATPTPTTAAAASTTTAVPYSVPSSAQNKDNNTSQVQSPQITPAGVIVCKDGLDEQDVFWEIDAVLDYKYQGSKLLWLVSWKNSTVKSWVLDRDLCDSAKQDAEILRNAKRLARKVRKHKGSLEEPIDLWAVDQDDSSARSWEEGRTQQYNDDDDDDENMSDMDDEGQGALDGAWSQKNPSRNQLKKRKTPRIGQRKKQSRSTTRTSATGTKTKKKSSSKKSTTKNSSIRRVANAPFVRTGGLRPEKNGMAMTFTVSNETQEPDNFLRRLANGQSILKLEYDTASRALPVAEFPDAGNRYSLVAIKNKRDKSYRGNASWGGGGSSQITLKYVQTNGSLPWNPREELEKVADFASLPRHKLSARLELLLTPAMKGPSLFDDWDVNMFEVLPEEDSYMGCGFIPDTLMKEIYAARKKTPIDSLQVRIFAPRIGVAKGMLTSKLGIDKIQIPPSMIKVGPSRKNKDPWAVMVVKNAAPSRYNRDLGRYLESPRPAKIDRTAPAEQNTLKPLSEMYQNLFLGLGVPPDVVKRYSKRQLSLAGRKHAHLMGVVDPTGKLPEGTIFVTGYTRTSKNQKIHMCDRYRKLFVTRSPCLEPTDGRIVPLVQSKPASMSDQEWQWLRDKPFGSLIFARPKNRHYAAPLPALIADGDLDGDLYFVLFEDEEVLPHLIRAFAKPKMRAEQKELEAQVRQENINLSEGPPPMSRSDNSEWFANAQEDMLKLDHIAGVGKLTGMLYRKSEKLGKESPDKIWNPDARAFAKAFKQSLDAYKHGNAIELPRHLEAEVDSMDKTKDKALKRLVRFV